MVAGMVDEHLASVLGNSRNADERLRDSWAREFERIGEVYMFAAQNCWFLGGLTVLKPRQAKRLAGGVIKVR